MNVKILNRNSEPPSDGWYQIEVTGTHPAGKGRKQLIDEKAITSMHNRFQKEKADAGNEFAGLLVDLDHLSHDLANSTEAYAWLIDTEIRNHQLWGKLDLSDLGETAIRNKRVKWFSTEYDPADLEIVSDGLVRPLRLAGLAFTNRPNNRGGKPISNRDGDKPGGEPTPNTETKPTMKSIAELLGLPADADEAAILDAIAKLQSKSKAAETKVAEAEAETVMNRFGDRVPEKAREGWKKRLITNRAEAEEAMEESFPEGAGKKGEKPIFNRADAKHPDPIKNDSIAADSKKAAAIRNRASAIQLSEKLPWNQAFSRAAAELS